MKILFVAMSDSVHVARWISNIADLGWDIHLFPSIDSGRVNPLMPAVTVHHSIYARQPDTRKDMRLRGLRPRLPFSFDLERKTAAVARFALRKVWPQYRAWQLARAIKRIKPDVIHAIEFQAAGYLTVEARKRVGRDFPKLIVSNYGSDIYLFGRLAAHRDRVIEVLDAADYYACECERDIALAQEFGFDRGVLPVVPSLGGFDLDRVRTFRQEGPVSARRTIMLKGYQNWAGRALFGLRAIEMCADVLQGYRIAIYAASLDADMKLAAELVAYRTGLQIDVIPRVSHDDILRLFGAARVYIGLSISDGISMSLLEALVMGAYPIQSCTACADEWLVDGETGAIVPPEDPTEIARRLREAVTNDGLVDRAAERNAAVCQERLDQQQVKLTLTAMYQDIAARVTKEGSGE